MDGSEVKKLWKSIDFWTIMTVYIDMWCVREGLIEIDDVLFEVRGRKFEVKYWSSKILKDMDDLASDVQARLIDVLKLIIQRVSKEDLLKVLDGEDVRIDVEESMFNLLKPVFKLCLDKVTHMYKLLEELEAQASNVPIRRSEIQAFINFVRGFIKNDILILKDLVEP